MGGEDYSSLASFLAFIEGRGRLDSLRKVK